MKIKNVVKKVTIAAMLATPALGAFSHSAALAASWVPNSKYYVSNPDDATNEDIYNQDADTSNRNFKRRSANIYVKDKSILPAVKKAIKLWAPKFKFKLVKSAKHASLTSSKYANIVVYDDNKADTKADSPLADITTTRVYEEKNPEVIKYTHGSKYGPYAEMRLTPKRIKFLKKNPGWQNSNMFMPKDWKKKAFTNHMNLVLRSKHLTEQGKVNAVAYQLGRAIGLGDIEQGDDPVPNSVNEYDDIMMADQCSYNKKWRVTQDNLDHIDWIYSHPYTSIADNTVRNGSVAGGL
ncbi:hypothetical protein FP435_03115 [Lactobacillus sp. PV037]|uniref:hypothetical protein n=1 Tax=unclassified Lactobacillus TaxID=2620435 RepID=UPI00223FEB08|nr:MULTISPECIES: hypothetical protein [unclassified Lactobacillus]QNQ82384.1 hypothetical protein FP433_04710 [Lactobacillus sp. PV012]QNQ83502.1 hypothetical protein FP435_03115 [Lactobacillus sp. PV037]